MRAALAGISARFMEDAMSSRKRLTRKELIIYLREQGYPIGDSTFEKLCMPTVNEGPPVDAWWGRRPLYDPDEALAWAERRTRQPGLGEARQGMATRGDAGEGTTAKPSLGHVPDRITTKPGPGDVGEGTATARSGRS
jgi:hypothetical protein